MDNNRSPTSGFIVDFKQDVAGVGGDVNFIKSTVDVRHYTEITSDIIGMARGQAGYAVGWGGKQLRMPRPFPGRSEPRSWLRAGRIRSSRPDPRYQPGRARRFVLLGGDLRIPDAGVLRAERFRHARWRYFGDVGQLTDYHGITYWSVTGETLLLPTDNPIRSSVGVGILWDSPIGPLRFDFAQAITKASYDKTQFFRFGGGTKF